MPLDIIIDDDKNSKSLALFIDDYDIIIKILEEGSEFPILRRSLLNYYGDSEVYLNELTILKHEVIRFIDLANKSVPDQTITFLNNFLLLIETAIDRRQTIKLIGD